MIIIQLLLKSTTTAWFDGKKGFVKLSKMVLIVTGNIFDTDL